MLPASVGVRIGLRLFGRRNDEEVWTVETGEGTPDVLGNRPVIPGGSDHTVVGPKGVGGVRSDWGVWVVAEDDRGRTSRAGGSGETGVPVGSRTTGVRCHRVRWVSGSGRTKVPGELRTKEVLRRDSTPGVLLRDTSLSRAGDAKTP